eukprot:2583348-Pyramimonas_sp.AAC.1
MVDVGKQRAMFRRGPAHYTLSLFLRVPCADEALAVGQRAQRGLSLGLSPHRDNVHFESRCWTLSSHSIQ